MLENLVVVGIELLAFDLTVLDLCGLILICDKELRFMYINLAYNLKL